MIGTKGITKLIETLKSLNTLEELVGERERERERERESHLIVNLSWRHFVSVFLLTIIFPLFFYSYFFLLLLCSFGGFAICVSHFQDLSYNGVDSKAAALLIEVIANNKSLKKVELNGNYLPKKSIKALEAALEANSHSEALGTMSENDSEGMARMD
jgi:hypothetical protein